MPGVSKGMRIATLAALVFVAGLTPGLVKHGQPLPNSGRNVKQPVEAFTQASTRPNLLVRLSRWTKLPGEKISSL
jgi:hypothetical protein